MYDAQDEKVAQRHRLQELAYGFEVLAEKCAEMGERGEASKLIAQASAMWHRVAESTPVSELDGLGLRVYAESWAGHATDLYIFDRNNKMVLRVQNKDFAKTGDRQYNAMFDALVQLLESGA